MMYPVIIPPIRISHRPFCAHRTKARRRLEKMLAMSGPETRWLEMPA
jgi:hypothetical protein